MRTSLVAVLITMLPVIGVAQSYNDFSVHLSGGIAVPFSTNDLASGMTSVMDPSLIIPSLKFADVWNPGLALGGGIGYQFDDYMSLTFDVGYNAFGADVEQVRSAFGLSNGEYVGDSELRAVSISGGLKYTLVDPKETFSPYAVANVGYMNVASDSLYILVSAYRNIVTRFESQDSFFGAVGVGVDISAGKRSSVYIEVQGGVAYTEKKSFMTFIPIRIGIKGGL